MRSTSLGATKPEHLQDKPATNLRLITPRRSLPGSRAIVGGLLVVVAAVGTFLIATSGSADHKTLYLVASHDLPAGSHLEAKDVRSVSVDLGPDVSGHALPARTRLAGATLLGPVKAGELLQTGTVALTTAGTNKPEVSFSIQASRALGGDLRPGETVDVVSSDKGSSALSARTVVSNAVVTRIDRGGSSALGRNSDMTVTLTVDDRALAAAVASAVDQGQVTLVRTTGINPAASATTNTLSAPQSAQH